MKAILSTIFKGERVLLYTPESITPLNSGRYVVYGYLGLVPFIYYFSSEVEAIKFAKVNQCEAVMLNLQSVEVAKYGCAIGVK